MANGFSGRASEHNGPIRVRPWTVIARSCSSLLYAFRAMSAGGSRSQQAIAFVRRRSRDIRVERRGFRQGGAPLLQVCFTEGVVQPHGVVRGSARGLPSVRPLCGGAQEIIAAARPWMRAFSRFRMRIEITRAGTLHGQPLLGQIGCSTTSGA
jgi:hypothetical protein